MSSAVVAEVRHKYVAILVLATIAAPVNAGEYNPVLSVGDKAPEWKELPGVDGKKYSLTGLEKKQVVVLAFTCNSCPYAVDYEERLVAFARKYTGEKKPVALVAVNVNKVEEDLPPKMLERAKSRGFTFPYLYDETQQIAKDYGAGATPEFFVLNQERKVVYMGSMDDSPDVDKVAKRYVEEAVQAALDGKLPEVKETVPIGCRIRFERTRRRRK